MWNDVNGTKVDPVLAENEVKRMLPLLEAARTVGMLIVHAPSEGAEWSKISVINPHTLRASRSPRARAVMSDQHSRFSPGHHTWHG